MWDCTYNDMAACRDKHVALLKRRSRDITARQPRTLRHTWTLPSRSVRNQVRILDQCLINCRAGGVPISLWGQGDTITSGLLKECKG